MHAGESDFVAALKADTRISEVLSEEELGKLLDPTTYIGSAPEIVDDIVAEYGPP